MIFSKSCHLTANKRTLNKQDWIAFLFQRMRKFSWGFHFQMLIRELIQTRLKNFWFQTLRKFHILSAWISILKGLESRISEADLAKFAIWLQISLNKQEAFGFKERVNFPVLKYKRRFYAAFIWYHEIICHGSLKMTFLTYLHMSPISICLSNDPTFYNYPPTV